MTKLVLVDEDVQFVKQMVTLLEEQHADWTIYSMNSAVEALELILCESVDVVVSETRLSDMDVVEFFEQVRASKPNALRFALSNDQNAELLLECARLNQRFISKSASVSILVESIESSMRIRDLLASENLTTLMQNVDSLPAIPELYDQLVNELASSDSSFIRVAEIIETDAGLTLSILKIVNSAYFGLNRRVESVSQAISLLGTAFVKNIALTSTVFSKFEGSNIDLKKLTKINNSALKISALTNQFSRYAKVPKISLNHCQIAGMMSNVGELIALTKADENFIETTPPHLLGAYLMKIWMMPDAVTEAIALQYEPIEEHHGDVTPLLVLHSIRHLQKNFTDTSNEQQRQECAHYLNTFLPEKLVDVWLDSYQALEQLVANKY